MCRLSRMLGSVPNLWKHKSYWYIHQFYHKKTLIVLIVMINVRFIYLIEKYAVNNILVKLPNILGLGEKFVNLKLGKLRVVTWKMSSKNSARVTFYNQITKALLKTWKLGWLIKHRFLIRPSENFTGWEYLKLYILMVWILRGLLVTFLFLLVSCNSAFLGA